MAFPAVTYTTNRGAASGMVNNAQEAGLSLNALNEIAQIQSVVANLLKNDPSTLNVPAADVSSGTFGANIPDTGTYTFPSALVWTTLVSSTTALATPAALGATTASAFASTVSGASIMGYGTTNDVTLFNRAGTVVLGVTANTVNVALAGAASYVTRVTSTTALATPAALVATTQTQFASTVSGAVLMGFGTTFDTTLKNRAGTDALGITANTVDVVMAGNLTVTGTITGITSATFSSRLTSTTGIATPSALVATTFTAFASTVSGASIMGFGTTNDVTLMNQAGTPVLGITANTTTVTLAGALTVTNATATSFAVTVTANAVNYIVVHGGATGSAASIAATGSDTDINITYDSKGANGHFFRTNAGAQNQFMVGHTASATRYLTVTGSNGGNPVLTATAGAIALGTSAGAVGVVIDGTAFGAATASLRLNGLTSGAAANTGTLTNAPSVGNPTFWIPVNIAGAVRYIPAWT